MKSILFTLVLLLVSATACGSSVSSNSSKASVKKIIPLPQMQIKKNQSVSVPFKKIVDRPLIILDPGHGGDDFGTHSLGIGKFHEKYLNLSTSVLVRSFLRQSGYNVIMTRTDDTFVPLDERAFFANRHKPKMFVSIHYNSAPSTSAEGIEVFYYQDVANKERTKKSKALAESVLSRLIQRTQARSRGVKQGNLAVLRGTDMPAILIEGGFMTNTDEMDKIKKHSYQKSLAAGIAQGVQDYLIAEGLDEK